MKTDSSVGDQRKSLVPGEVYIKGPVSAGYDKECYKMVRFAGYRGFVPIVWAIAASRRGSRGCLAPQRGQNRSFFPSGWPQSKHLRNRFIRREW